MPSQLISKTVRPAQRDIYAVVMDDYGAELHITLPVSVTAAERAAKVQAAIATMDAGQASMESAATAEGIDISGLKTEGQAKRAARIAAAQKK